MRGKIFWWTYLMDRLWLWNVFLGIKLMVTDFILRLEMKVKQYIIVACVSKELAKVTKYQGIIMVYFMKLFVLNSRVSQLKNVYFLIMSDLTQMFLGGCVILNLPHIPRLIIPDVTESLTHSYLLMLQPKWYMLSTLRGYQEKRIGG